MSKQPCSKPKEGLGNLIFAKLCNWKTISTQESLIHNNKPEPCLNSYHGTM